MADRRQSGKVVTFYSFKGGVGRTMALANAAVALAASGERVLAIDWDLEAPGLDKFFRGLQFDAAERAGGLLALIGEGMKRTTSQVWPQFIQDVRLSSDRRLSFLPSGSGVGDYESKVLDLDWQDFYRADGGDFLEELRQDWKEKFDFVLIDSRTGLTDSSGICTIQLPDILVLVFTANEQSMMGAKEIALRAKRGRQKLAYARMELSIVPLLTRWDGREEQEEGEKWLLRVENEMSEFYGSWAPSDESPRNIVESLRVPHVAFYSFGEKLPVLTQESLTDSEKPGKSYLTLAALLHEHDWRNCAAVESKMREQVEELRRQVGARQSHRRIFLSAVSSEFGSYFDGLSRELRLSSFEVHRQEDFRLSSGSVLEQVNDYIRQCDVVVHLVGKQPGAVPPPVSVQALLRKHPDLLQHDSPLGREPAHELEQISYTQWEAYLALLYRKPLFVFQATPDVVRDQAARGNELIQHSQDAHAERMRKLVRVAFFSNKEELTVRVLASLSVRKPVALPYPSLGSLFKGREDFLQQLRGSLLRAGDGRATAITAKAIHGLGGVGKTRLAVEYAWQHADDYSAVLFVSADSPENLRRNLAELVGPLVLDLQEQQATEEEVRLAAVLRWLREHPGWFLILDNVDDERAAGAAENLLARLNGGQVLITSRLARWSGCVEPLELDVLAEPDAARFLLERTASRRRKQGSDEADATQLAAELDGLALALEQAGAYINQMRITLAEYLKQWRAHQPAVQQWHDQRRMKYSRSVAVAWQTTLDQLSGDEIALLNILAWFAPEPVPVSVLGHFSLRTLRSLRDKEEQQAENAEHAEEVDVREWLGKLADFSMIRWEVEAETVSVHRVVQEILRTQQNEPQAYLTAAFRLLDAAIPKGNSGDVRTWPAWEPLRPHVAFVAREADRLEIPEPTSRLMGELGTLLWAKALYHEAEALMRRALAIDEQQYAPDSTQVAMRLNNLAQTLQATNRLAEAEPLMRRALAIDEQSYGAEHPNVAIRLNNLAALFHDTNRLGEAETLMRRVVDNFEKSLGAEHPEVATSLNNLAQLLQATNRLAEAEPLMRRALAIDEQSYGAEHPRVATQLNNLAQLLKATNRLAEAEPLMRRALAIDEQAYGAEHPDVALDLNNLAQLLQSTNRLNEAEPLMRRALAIYEQSFGAEHPNVAAALNNLAQLLQSTNRIAEAEPLMRRALAIEEASTGSEHPAVATDLNNLASLLVATNRLAEAEPLMRRALAIDEEAYGPEHPSVAIRLHNLARLLQQTGRTSEAEPLMRRALSIFQQARGTEHPNVITAVRNYEILLGSLGLDEADIATRIGALMVRENVASS